MLEIERKYLIRMPDVKTLNSLEAFSEHNIEQTYLKAENGVTRRVRRSVCNGIASFIYNEKRRVSPISCIEDEHEISESEYLLLLAEKENNTSTVSKTRCKFFFKGQCFEIDIYPFSSDVAVCETELESEDTQVEFPQFIEILSEVSGDRAFSNHSIAKQLFKGNPPF